MCYQTIQTRWRQQFRRWLVHPLDQMVARFSSMVLQVDACHQRSRFAKLRVDQNPFNAENSGIGFGRVDISHQAWYGQTSR